MAIAIGQANILWGEGTAAQSIPEIGSLSDFTYDDDLKEDSVCQLVFSSCPIDVADRTEIQQGQKVTISWGRGQSLGDPVVMTIEEPEVEYGPGVTLYLRCHDKGTETKGLTRHRTWPANKTLKDVVEEIGNSWGFETIDIEAYDGDFDRVQNRESDFRYLQRQAEKIGYRFWIDAVADTLHFRIDSQGAPLNKFIYRSGNLLKKFRVRTSRQQKKGSQTKTTAQGFNLKTRSIVDGEATAESDQDTQLSGGYVTVDAEDGGYREVIGRRIITPHSKQADVDRAAHGARKADARGQQEATMEIPGLSYLRAGIFITIEGVAQTHAGIWRIKKSTHRIGSRGFSCQLVLDRETTGSRTGGVAIGEAAIPDAVINDQEAAEGEDKIIDGNTGEQIFNP